MSKLPVPATSLPVPSSPRPRGFRALEETAAKLRGEELAPPPPALGGMSPAEYADRHIQKWREGITRLMLEMQLNEDLDDARLKLVRTEGWKLLKEASLESAKVMAELRPFWNPESKVETRD